LTPSAVVIVATVRALKHHGGALKAELSTENLVALEKGIPNLLKHIENINVKFGLPAVVAINRFPTDTEAELKLVEEKCKEYGANVALSEVWGKGSEGGVDLANEVVRLVEEGKSDFKYIYPDDMPLKDKIRAVVQNVYGGDDVDFSGPAIKEIARLEEMGFQKLPICMAKTQYSLSDDPKKLGWPRNFNVSVRNVKVSAGAGFVVVLTGDIMTMPGLPKVPSAESIDVDSTGRISGLF
jgi:formate--tetrahydrofolate ligase